MVNKIQKLKVIKKMYMRKLAKVQTLDELATVREQLNRVSLRLLDNYSNNQFETTAWDEIPVQLVVDYEPPEPTTNFHPGSPENFDVVDFNFDIKEIKKAVDAIVEEELINICQDELAELKESYEQEKADALLWRT